MANGKHRKTRFFCLEQDEGVIEGDENLKKFITNYYKGLFRKPAGSKFSLVESVTSDIPQASQIGNEVLMADFLEKEIKEAIF